MVSNNHNDIILKAKKGDADAFSKLVELYGDNLYAFALTITGGDKATAADIYQEALLKAYSYMNTYNDKYAFSTWLWNICKNTYLTFIKKESKISTVPMIDNYKEELCSSLENTEKSISKKEMRKKLLELIGKLPLIDREILTLVELREMKIKNAAELIGVSENTAKVRVYRARKRLYELALSEKTFF